MIASGHVVAVTLAAGLSRRFGGDKLSAQIMGTCVLDASMAALDGFAFAGRAVVLNPSRVETWDRADVAVIRNTAPERGMGHSLALAAQYAADSNARFLLVTLGDMPRISPETIAALLRAGPDRGDALVAARPDEMPPGPPAIFGCDWFARLAGAEGDTGARTLLRDPAHAVVTLPLSPAEAIDIDTPADLAAATPERSPD
ncbi:nucleotidyltransferase family protein [uncultured Croceicoccus sp.]|uniref:nucleotidyltransferase family protein n=1 Tax=uncultured Croceicoccus sp. TaxID=1295329 RepID=UPI0026094184|nr:nucleotidyltransferase family protein [uncultured Croceicoccus sp.]